MRRRGEGEPAQAAAQLCDAHGGAWGGFAERADVSGACGYCDDAGVYACGAGAFEGGASAASSAGAGEAGTRRMSEFAELAERLFCGCWGRSAGLASIRCGRTRREVRAFAEYLANEVPGGRIGRWSICISGPTWACCMSGGWARRARRGRWRRAELVQVAGEGREGGAESGAAGEHAEAAGASAAGAERGGGEPGVDSLRGSDGRGGGRRGRSGTG